MLRLIFLLLLTGSLTAQDAQRHHFRGHESDYNPAFTGQTGASRLTAAFSGQWDSNGNPGNNARNYSSRSISYEEGLPCFFFDYGLFARTDTEGDGGLTTDEFGGRLAIAVPILKQYRNPTLNLRAGFGLTRGQRRIDYNSLLFLDQLDQFYGPVDENGAANPTGFLPPNGSVSPRYTTPSFGVSLKGGINTRYNQQRQRPVTFDVGAAVHNFASLTTRDSRQTASLLGMDVPLGQRVVLSASGSAVVATHDKRYWTVHPLLVVQLQEGLGYLETGAALSWNRNLEVGFFQHWARPAEGGPAANWSTLRVEVGQILPGDYTRVDVGMSWSFQHGPLKNFVRAPFALTATLSFGRSLGCLAVGRPENDFVRGARGKTDCYSFATARNRIYDNIWYR